MNNKGQSLVLFVIVIPVIIIMLVLVIDASKLYYEKNKIDNINVLVLTKYFDKNDAEIENIIIKNDDKISEIVINREDKSILLKKDIDLTFSGVLKNKYEIESKYKIVDDKIIKG